MTPTKKASKKHLDLYPAPHLVEIEPKKNIFEKIDNNEYVSKLEYMSMANVKSDLIKIGQLISDIFETIEPSPSRSEMITIAMKKASESINILDRIYENNRKVIDDELALHNKFREDLITEFGTRDNPYENAIFSHAWENGHASGHIEVANIYMELAEDFKYPPKNK